MKMLLALSIICATLSCSAATNVVAKAKVQPKPITQPLVVQTNAVEKTTATTGFMNFISNTDWPRTGQAALMVAAGIGVAYYCAEYVDPHESNNGPASAPPKPVQQQPAVIIGGGGPQQLGSEYIVKLSGQFLGQQQLACGRLPGLTFTPGTGYDPAMITGYVGTASCQVLPINSRLRVEAGGQLLILVPDEFYYGPVRIDGGSLVLQNGTRLSGGSVSIIPVQQ